MGRPRQEDLLSSLGEAVAKLDWLHIDLTPIPL